VALTGGLNVGDEYMGRDPEFGPWRDTHLKVMGPVVQALQLSFLEDWHWATSEVMPLNWVPVVQERNQSAGVLPTGPADPMETCTFALLQAINSAKRRLWMASPYFVLDSTVMMAVQLAALRGVDVRIMIPKKSDHWLPHLTSFSYYEELYRTGVKLFRYAEGFMHQKVLLADDDFAVVGSINLDYRSFRLNFELGVAVFDRWFAEEVEAMLNADFEKCEEEDLTLFKHQSLWFRAKVRFARLMAPIQ